MSVYSSSYIYPLVCLFLLLSFELSVLLKLKLCRSSVRVGWRTNKQLSTLCVVWYLENSKNSNKNQSNSQEAVISELKQANAVREKKLLQQEDVYNGALEDILLGLKSEPYRRADAVRRSQRRRIDSNRYSRTLDEDF